MQASLDRVTVAVETMSAEQGLSESARRILHRKEERELLIREIERDISGGDWESAMVLVRELGEGFGYRADAEALRKRVERAREQTDDQRAVDAVAKVQVFIQNRAWPEAYSEAASVLRLFPDSHRTQGLRERVGAARDRYRTDLERRFCKAAAEHDTQALELLKELDQYLTPEEAAPYQEVARGVIGQTRENLGSRFKLLVQDHEYAAAVEIGQQIVREFPNTRMAAEVREMIPKLAERAGVSL
jgi:hypothetical protein